MERSTVSALALRLRLIGNEAFKRGKEEGKETCKRQVLKLQSVNFKAQQLIVFLLACRGLASIHTSSGTASWRPSNPQQPQPLALAARAGPGSPERWPPLPAGAENSTQAYSCI
eukprot:1139018-Pelagomonas_calceolata.AAC.6